MTCGFLITTGILITTGMWFIGVEAEQETNAPPPKKNPGSAPALERNETEQINIKSVIKRLRQQIIYRFSQG